MSFVRPSRGRREPGGVSEKFVQAVLSQDAAEMAAREAEISRRVRQELGKLRAAAEAAGRAEGEAAAQAALAQQTAALAQAAAALGHAAAELAAPLAGREAALGDLVLELALTVAAHITGVTAPAPAHLQALIMRLLAEAAAERPPGHTIVVRISPADHAAVAGLIPPATASLLADAGIAAGGAVVEILAPDGDRRAATTWDATVAGRFKNLAAMLGCTPP